MTDVISLVRLEKTMISLLPVLSDGTLVSSLAHFDEKRCNVEETHTIRNEAVSPTDYEEHNPANSH